MGMLPPTLAQQGLMSKAEVYRSYAAKCRQQSEKATGEDKALWLKIAYEWMRMAEAAARNPDAF
jgi:hypothetical protein